MCVLLHGVLLKQRDLHVWPYEHGNRVSWRDDERLAGRCALSWGLLENLTGLCVAAKRAQVRTKGYGSGDKSVKLAFTSVNTSAGLSSVDKQLLLFRLASTFRFYPQVLIGIKGKPLL